MSEEKAISQNEKSEIVDIDDTETKKEKAKESSAGVKDYARIFTYSDKWDWLLNGAGAIAAAASGASLAL